MQKTAFAVCCTLCSTTAPVMRISIRQLQVLPLTSRVLLLLCFIVLQCGVGLTTEKNGSVAADQCRIKPGWGIKSFVPLEAEMCNNNRYGDPAMRPVVASARCVPCAPNLFTMDVLRTMQPPLAIHLSRWACRALSSFKYHAEQTQWLECCMLQLSPCRSAAAMHCRHLLNSTL